MPSSYDIDDPDFDAWDEDNVEDLLDTEAEADDTVPLDEPSYQDLVSATPREAAQPVASSGNGREQLRNQAREAAKRLLREHIAAILPHALQQSGLLAYRAPAERARLHQACMRGLSVEFPLCAGRLFARNEQAAGAERAAIGRELRLTPVLACTSARLARRFRNELTKQDTDALVAAITDLIPVRVLRLDGDEALAAPRSVNQETNETPAAGPDSDQLAVLRRTLVDALTTLDSLAAAQSRRAL
ncbi:hypothetical protein [Maricaulis sp.]|uniref:hypothetical protein n=1 Tax=Maricaulis sp. TaxID=1486257 RepID=UPI002616EF7A|nr:hypothetical protein [Maricaulis sp.]